MGSGLRSVVPRPSADVVLPFLAALLHILSVFFVFRVLILHEGPAIVGVWALTMGLIALAGLLNLSGAAGLPRFLPGLSDAPRRQAQFIDTVSLFVLALFAVLCAAAYLPLDAYIRSQMQDDGLPVPDLFVAFVLLSFVLSMLANAQARALEGVFLARQRAMAEIVGVAIFCGGSLSLVERSGIEGVALARVAQYAVVVLLTRGMLCRQIVGLSWLPRRFHSASFREAMGLGARIQGAAVAEAVWLAVSRVLIEAFWGLAALGIFEIAARLMQSVHTLFQQTMIPVVARFARDRETADAGTGNLADVIQRTLAFGTAAYALALAGTPVASLALLDRVDPDLLRSAAALSVGWFAALLVLPLIYYARGAGLLRATVIGLWSLCLLTAVLLAAAGAAGLVPDPALVVSLAMVAGYAAMGRAIARETAVAAADLYPRARVLAALAVVVLGAALLSASSG